MTPLPSIHHVKTMVGLAKAIALPHIASRQAHLRDEADTKVFLPCSAKGIFSD